jgi:hypothetical protein
VPPKFWEASFLLRIGVIAPARVARLRKWGLLRRGENRKKRYFFTFFDLVIFACTHFCQKKHLDVANLNKFYLHGGVLKIHFLGKNHKNAYRPSTLFLTFLIFFTL